MIRMPGMIGWRCNRAARASEDRAGTRPDGPDSNRPWLAANAAPDLKARGSADNGRVDRGNIWNSVWPTWNIASVKSPVNSIKCVLNLRSHTDRVVPRARNGARPQVVRSADRKPDLDTADRVAVLDLEWVLSTAVGAVDRAQGQDLVGRTAAPPADLDHMADRDRRGRKVDLVDRAQGQDLVGRTAAPPADLDHRADLDRTDRRVDLDPRVDRDHTDRRADLTDSLCHAARRVDRDREVRRVGQTVFLDHVVRKVDRMAGLGDAVLKPDPMASLDLVEIRADPMDSRGHEVAREEDREGLHKTIARMMAHDQGRMVRRPDPEPPTTRMNR